MTGDETSAIVVAQASALAPRMYEGVSSALAAAEVRARGLSRTKYPHFRPMATRIELREDLERGGLTQGWEVQGDPRAMGQLCLAAPTLGLKLRFLKERRATYPGGVPVAGSNQARRDVWTGKQLSLYAPRELTPQSVRPVSELLLLWDYASKETAADGFTLRIVRPVAPGIYGRPVPYDLDIALQPGGTIFTKMEFAGDVEDEDLFATAEIDRAENDE